MKPKTAILLSTCDKYAALARFARERIDDIWPRHPAVSVCGLSAGEMHDALSFDCDERDWVGITQQAVRHLAEVGYDYCYLIMEDHFPIGPCNGDYLNTELPAQAQQLKAMHVGLVGWDQFSPSAGHLLKRDHGRWMRNARDFKWKFDLHPGLWEVSRLLQLLTWVRGGSGGAVSARDFETRAGAADADVPEEWLSSTYRIPGDDLAIGTRWFQDRRKRPLAKRGIDLIRLFSRLTGGSTRLRAVDARLAAYLHYLNGPYPMHWSGLLKQGSLNRGAIRFLKKTGRAALAADIERIVAT